MQWWGVKLESLRELNLLTKHIQPDNFVIVKNPQFCIEECIAWNNTLSKLVEILQANFFCLIVIIHSGEKSMQNWTQALKKQKVL